VGQGLTGLVEANQRPAQVIAHPGFEGFTELLLQQLLGHLAHALVVLGGSQVVELAHASFHLQVRGVLAPAGRQEPGDRAAGLLGDHLQHRHGGSRPPGLDQVDGRAGDAAAGYVGEAEACFSPGLLDGARTYVNPW